MDSKVDKDVENLREEVDKLRQDLADIGGTLKTLLNHAGADAKASLRDLDSHLGETLTGLNEAIEKKPLVSALMAFGIGMFLGTLFRPKARN